MHNRKLLKQIFKQLIFSPSTGTEHYFKIHFGQHVIETFCQKIFLYFFSKNK